jgi:uncharacterized membrane protein (DUF2068 family)
MIPYFPQPEVHLVGPITVHAFGAIMDRVAEGTRHRGLRVVAVFEGAKGGLVLVTGFGLLAYIHRDLHSAAEEIVRHLHLNPARHYPRIFLDAAARVTDTQLWLLALTAFLYAVVRFIEAFGLWRRKRWAAWFGVLSGGVYVPVELFEVAHRLSWVKLGVLSVNLAIVAYLGYELTTQGRPSRNPFLPRSPRRSRKT